MFVAFPGLTDLEFGRNFRERCVDPIHFLSDNNLGIQLDGHFLKFVYYAKNNHNGFTLMLVPNQSFIH